MQGLAIFVKVRMLLDKVTPVPPPSSIDKPGGCRDTVSEALRSGSGSMSAPFNSVSCGSLRPFPLHAARVRVRGAGEHCLSTWPRSGSCELRSRPIWRATQGTPELVEGARNRGGLLFDYFCLAKQEKVISSRAAPGRIIPLFVRRRAR